MATPAEALSTMHDLAAVGAIDPMKAVMIVPATIGAVGTAASIFTVVKKGEMGIRTLGGHLALLEFGVELVDISLYGIARTSEECLAQAIEKSDPYAIAQALPVVRELTKANVISTGPTDAA